MLPTSLLTITSLAASFLLGTVVADDNVGKCLTQKNVCGQYSPCCNSGGWCGNSYQHCGIGCYQPGNYKQVKCLPPPACKESSGPFSKDRIVKLQDYKGNYTNFDFTIDGDYEVQNGEVVLKMSKSGTGSTLQSTRYINYGKITAVMKTARGQGVISSFITMSDTKDEIDIEWVGKDLEGVQTNWFHNGVIPEQGSSQGRVHKSPDTYNEYHTYVIDWSEHGIKWYMDNNLIREQKREGDTFPITPSRFSFGIWDGSSQAEGTREWAGGYVDWKSEDMKKQGYYSVRVKSFKVECYGPATSKDSDFDYDDKLGLVHKGSIKKASKNRNSSVPDGDEHMFDIDPESDQEGGSSKSPNVVKRQVSNQSSASIINYSAFPLYMAFLLYLN